MLRQLGRRPSPCARSAAAHESSCVIGPNSPAVRQPIQAAVADVPDHRAVAVDEQADKGRAHAGVVVVAFRRAEHAAIREMNARAQTVGQERQLRVDAVRPREIGVALGSTDEAAQRLERQLRRHFTGVVAAHAVGDGEQADLGRNQPGVFVDRSYWSGFGLGVSSQHGRKARSQNARGRGR